MRSLCALSLVILVACGGGGDPIVTPPPPPVAASVVVSNGNPGALSGLVGGNQVQVQATVKTAAGEIIAGAPVTWSTSLPGLSSVSQAGLVTLADTALGSRAVTVTATSGAASGQATLLISDWSLSREADPVSLVITTLASRTTATGSGALSLRCRAGLFELFVTGTVITQDGSVTYRFSGRNPVAATWVESTNFKSLFAPSAAAAKAFADQFATADTLYFQYREFQAGLITMIFPLNHSGSAYPRVGATCGL